VLVLFCVLNEEVQEAWKLACFGKKGQTEEATRSTQVGESRSSPGVWGQAACLGQELTGTSPGQVGRPCPGLRRHLLNRARALSPASPGPQRLQQHSAVRGERAHPHHPGGLHRLVGEQRALCPHPLQPAGLPQVGSGAGLRHAGSARAEPAAPAAVTVRVSCLSETT